MIVQPTGDLRADHCILFDFRVLDLTILVSDLSEIRESGVVGDSDILCMRVTRHEVQTRRTKLHSTYGTGLLHSSGALFKRHIDVDTGLCRCLDEGTTELLRQRSSLGRGYHPFLFQIAFVGNHHAWHLIFLSGAPDLFI